LLVYLFGAPDGLLGFHVSRIRFFAAFAEAAVGLILIVGGLVRTTSSASALRKRGSAFLFDLIQAGYRRICLFVRCMQLASLQSLRGSSAGRCARAALDVVIG
jgi:hypothetical protein